MSELPTGTVTFLFTDIEGSTRLLQALGGDAYARVQDEHAAIMRRAIAAGHGVEVRTEGDSFFVVFPTAAGALGAAVAAQRELTEHAWPHGRALQVRMGLHTGDGILGGDDYLGIDVNLAARVGAAGHGGQVLLSEATRVLVDRAWPDDVTVRDLGLHRLKDFVLPQRLHDVVISGLVAEFPPLRSLDAPRTNLPEPRSSFVGREREIAEITEHLSATRLLTLTGPGGTGKTRLALKVAAEHLDRFRDGVSFVDLSPITDPALVLPRIAGVLRVRETAGRDPADTVGEHLEERELLLVLDNLEQLVESAPAVGKLLERARSIKILGTSRIPLRLSGEQEYHVDPLALPDPDALEDPERLNAYDSVRLLVGRAAAVRPGFRITGGTARAVAGIAARLDGLPLALELAASRMKVLSPEALLTRLDERLPLLTGGARDVPERQRTLRGAIGWSHDLLEAEDQRLFARLSVFVGGWSLDAAEAVCPPDTDVLDGIGSLVDHSLVRRTEAPDGELRFRMLETIREYAAERLAASGEEDDLRRRHAGFFRGLAEEAGRHVTGEGQVRWLGVLEREHDDIRAALDWAEGSGDIVAALVTATAIWRFWQLQGHLGEGRTRLERLLALPAAQGRDAIRARALGALGGIVYWLGDYEPVRVMYEEAMDIAREVGEPKLLSWALLDLSYVPMVIDGDLAAGERLLRESLAAAEETDLALRAQIWNGLGYLELFRGNQPAAIEATERAMAIHREVGDRLFLIEGLVGLAGIHFLGDRVDLSRGPLQEATALAIEWANPISLAGVLKAHAHLANHDGHHDRAARLIGVWARIEQDLDARFPSMATAYFGDPAVEARAALGDEEFERSRAEGFAMSRDEIVELMTDDEAPPL